MPIFDPVMLLWDILTVFFFLASPAGVLWLCRKIPVLGKIGPVLILYIIGVIFGNVFHPSGMASIQDILSSATVPLAIPLMLFGCTFSRAGTRSRLLAMLTGIVAVVTAVAAGYLIFARDIPEGAKIGGMLTAVYTGGTVNMAALKAMLGVRDETFVLLNSYDMAVSFLYLTFLLGFGIRFFRRILPVETSSGSAEDESATAEALRREASNPYAGIFTKRGFRDVAALLGIDAVIIGVSAGLGLLCGDGWFMTVLILMLTTLGIAASFIPGVKKLRYSYETGMYFIYVFSVVVASMADLGNLNPGDSAGLLGYLAFVIFGSLLIQVLLARIFRIDADTMTISSVTYICSPPFVPMMAAAMKNRSVLASGLAIGVVGYAVGNYLGFLLAGLLATF